MHEKNELKMQSVQKNLDEHRQNCINQTIMNE
jgi:hypothetical protein